MAPRGLRHQLKAWSTYTATNLMLGRAFSIEIREASSACQTLGGLEFSEICNSLIDYATGVMVTLEKTACSILRGYIPGAVLEKGPEPLMAKYGDRIIKLKGGKSQFEMMQNAVDFLQPISDAVNSVDNANIDTKDDLRKWLATEFSGEKYDERFEKICAAAEKLLPLAQQVERKKVGENSEAIKRINTCLWMSIESDEPFTVKADSGEVLAEDTLRAQVETSWPATVFVEASLLRLE